MRTTRPLWIPTLFAALACATAPAPSPAADGPLRAGAATLDVTPFLDDPIIGNFDTPPASYVHDPLHARALVLDDGSTRLAFVVVDSVGISRDVCDAARKIVAEKAGVPAANLLARPRTRTRPPAGGRRTGSRPTPTAG